MNYSVPQIDTFVENTTYINGKEVIVKPLPESSIIKRILHAWAVLTGEATAVIFLQDIVDAGNEAQRKFNGK